MHATIAELVEVGVRVRVRVRVGVRVLDEENDIVGVTDGVLDGLEQPAPIQQIVDDNVPTGHEYIAQQAPGPHA